ETMRAICLVYESARERKDHQQSRTACASIPNVSRIHQARAGDNWASIQIITLLRRDDRAADSRNGGRPQYLQAQGQAAPPAPAPELSRLPVGPGRRLH